MRTDAHFSQLADACACHNCFVNRRVKKVADRLMGRPKPKPDTPLFQFGFTGFKQLDWSTVDGLRYGTLSNIHTSNPRTSFALAKIQGV